MLRRLALPWLVALLLVAAGAARAEPGPVAAKRAEARRVLVEVGQLDARLERSVEAFNAARIRLDGIQGRLRTARAHLALARRNLRVAQSRLARLAVALYLNDERPTPLQVVLGAGSLGDALDGLEAERDLARQDVRVIGEVRSFRREAARQRRNLTVARGRQQRVVGELRAARRSIEQQLGERKRLLSTIQDEIVRLRAEERRRQERLRQEAEARVRAAVAAQERTPAPQPVVGATAVSAEDVAVVPPGRHGHVVPIAMQYLGIPYKWGGASPSEGFDCSGFVMYVYAQVGISLPHNAAMQYQYGVSVSKDELEPGDIVFFNNLGHNGIYIGGGQFIQAPRTGDVVKISSLSEPWYAATYYGAKRLP